jgi:hypothetical protein
MNQESLDKTLDALRKKLAATRPLDDKLQRLVRDTMSEIGGHNPPPGSSAPVIRRHRLEELAVGFEVEHPKLAADLRELMDLLVKGGV